jgi:hypothetical protein
LAERTTLQAWAGARVSVSLAGSIDCQATPSLPVKVYCCSLHVVLGLVKQVDPSHELLDELELEELLDEVVLEEWLVELLDELLEELLEEVVLDEWLDELLEELLDELLATQVVSA